MDGLSLRMNSFRTNRVGETCTFVPSACPDHVFPDFLMDSFRRPCPPGVELRFLIRHLRLHPAMQFGHSRAAQVLTGQSHGASESAKEARSIARNWGTIL
jgi:hypothetical protein